METIAIVGGGIVGTTLASYLDPKKYRVLLFDQDTGQATKASAGIISPWLSKRRNKQWYHLAQDGAAFFQKMTKDLQLSEEVYKKSGTLYLRKPEQLSELFSLAEDRKKNAPEIGDIKLLTGNQAQAMLPLLKQNPALFISGGGRLDGKAFLQAARKQCENQGVQLINQRVTLNKKTQSWQLQTSSTFFDADIVCLTSGPGITPLLAPLDYEVDVRPQKGQLLFYQTGFQSDQWPVAMLDGEGDLIPFNDGKILLGATHENQAGWDLNPTASAASELKTKAAPFLECTNHFFSSPMHYRVGTRAYTSDFAPFFAPTSTDSSLIVASGLGSSGLTTGPYIGYLLAAYLNHGSKRYNDYQKSITNYVRLAKDSKKARTENSY